MKGKAKMVSSNSHFFTNEERAIVLGSFEKFYLSKLHINLFTILREIDPFKTSYKFIYYSKGNRSWITCLPQLEIITTEAR